MGCPLLTDISKVMPAHDKCTFQILHSFYDFQSVLRKPYNTFSYSSYKHGIILIKGGCFNSCVSRQHVQLLAASACKVRRKQKNLQSLCMFELSKILNILSLLGRSQSHSQAIKKALQQEPLISSKKSEWLLLWFHFFVVWVLVCLIICLIQLFVIRNKILFS